VNVKPSMMCCRVDPWWTGKVPWDGPFLSARWGCWHECCYFSWAVCCGAWHQGGHCYTGQYSSRPSTWTACQCLPWGECSYGIITQYKQVFTCYTWNDYQCMLWVVTNAALCLVLCTKLIADYNFVKVGIIVHGCICYVLLIILWVI